MERCKLSELSISAVTEQNTTDEEKSAAASGSEITNWNRYKGSIKDFVELLPHLPSPYIFCFFLRDVSDLLQVKITGVPLDHK